MDLLFGLVLCAGLTAALMLYSLMPTPSPIVRRFQRYAPIPLAVRPTLGARLTRSVAPALATHLPLGYLDARRSDLKRAGWFGPSAFERFLAAQALLAVLGALVGAASGLGSLPAALVVGACAGACGPVLVLKAAGQRRRQAIQASLPDTLDLMTACAEAGLGLDAAIAQLCQRRSPASVEINRELARYLQELQVGRPRAEALKELGERAGVDDLRRVVTALAQGDSLGVGVASVLRAQSAQIRLQRKQRAEERAMKAPVKIVFPLVFGIFPAMFVLILGPAVLHLLDTFVGKL